MSDGPVYRTERQEARFFVYKMTNDSGAAPCVEGRVLSLAICKPQIRKSARVGDIIFGFAAKSLHPDNRLIYVAKVTEVVPDGRYYKDQRFKGRKDRIYAYRDGGYVRRNNALFHARPEDLVHDLGAGPGHAAAVVLLSGEFRYFGGSGTNGYKARPPLRALVEGFGRGHRVNHDPDVLKELQRLKRNLWATTRAGKSGRPTTPPKPRACHRGGSSVIVCRQLPSAR